MALARVAAKKKKTPAISQRPMRAVVTKKRFKTSSGKYGQVSVLDANVATFGTDLLEVFRENVAKARKENIRLFGSPDRVPDGK
jgi:tellurite resistance-related uncharacterized protein